METGERPPVFPYHILWEEIGDAKITFGSLTEKAETFELLFDAMRRLGADTPYVDRAILARLIAPLELTGETAARMIEEIFLVAGWYVEPLQRKWMKGDLASARRDLAKIATASRTLYELLGGLAPQAGAAIHFVRGLEPDAFDPDKDLSTLTLTRMLHDLALVADRIVTDTAPPKTGRKSDYVRNTALRLAIESVEQASRLQVQMSRGTQASSEPYFVGPAGTFVKQFFKLIAPKTSERVLVRVAERIRRERP